MTLLLALAASQKRAQGTGGTVVTPPPGTPMPSTSDRRLNIAVRDSGITNWAAADPNTITITDNIGTRAHGRNPSVLLVAGGVDVTYSGCSLTDVASGYAYPVTVNGQATWTVTAGSYVETDPITLLSISGSAYQWAATVSRPSSAASTGRAVAALIAHSLTPSVLIIGDSNAPASAGFPQGGVSQAGLPVINIAGSGNRVESFYAGGKLVDAYLTSSSHCLSEIGVNNTDWNVSQLGAGLLQLANRASAKGQRFYQCTIAPRTSLTDGASWDTVTDAQQTWPQPQARDFNPWIRDGLPTSSGAYVAAGTVGATRAGDAESPFAGWIDTAQSVESSLGSWKWKPGTTGDGTHLDPSYSSSVVSQVVKVWAQSVTL